MPAIDRSIARTLLCAPSIRKWIDYQTHFYDFFVDRWPLFDQLIAFIFDFHRQFQDVPSYQAFESELIAANDTVLLEYLRTTAQDTSVTIHSTDVEFAAGLRVARNQCFQHDLFTAMAAFQSIMQGSPAYLPTLLKGLEEMLVKLYTAQRRALGSNAETSMLLYGPEAQAEMRAHYDAIKEKLSKDEDLYYNLSFKTLDADVQIKAGDLVVVGAYSSQGKSTLLRSMAHHFLTTYGLNVVFCSLEVTAETERTKFALLHANDKALLPGTPAIKPIDYKAGKLTAEQEDFLLNVANKILTQEPRYGSLQLEYPNKFGYTLRDLQQRLAVIQTRMPVHVLVIDYVTYMSPVLASRYAPVRPDDYNQMIRELKRACLTNLDAHGVPAPLICLTAAQISRRGYEEAIKRDGLCDLQAFSTYTEIERSADIALTTYMTPAMRQASQLRLQVQKNRDGAVPTEPLTLHIDFQHGSQLRELTERTQAEAMHIMTTLTL